MYRVGLTGGIGSGKSTVADHFAALGAGIVDADALAHAITAPGGAAMPAIREAFGSEFVAPDGRLDRVRMRKLAFADGTQRARLEAILHPLIQRETARQAADLAKRHPYVILVVPLLIESGNWQKRVDRVLVVDCAENIQIERVMKRSGLAADDVRNILHAQASRIQRNAAADDLIDNSGGPELLPTRVAVLHEKYCDLAKAKPAQGE